MNQHYCKCISGIDLLAVPLPQEAVLTRYKNLEDGVSRGTTGETRWSLNIGGEAAAVTTAAATAAAVTATVTAVTRTVDEDEINARTKIFIT